MGAERLRLWRLIRYRGSTPAALRIIFARHYSRAPAGYGPVHRHVGFTTFSERSGEEAAFTLMRSLAKLMDEAVREQGGVVQSHRLEGAPELAQS
jgi:hypothetical protein